MKEQKKIKESGITLITLVVTIIVLLILAGISIQMLTGDNGILNRAVEAKEKSEEAQIKERIRMAYNSAIVRDLSKEGGNLTTETLEDEINKEFGTEGSVIDSRKYWAIIVNGKEYDRIKKEINYNFEIGGDCGDNVKWGYADGQLVIYGSGDMEDYNYQDTPLWEDYKGDITTVIIDGDITRIGNWAFCRADNLTEVIFDTTALTSIGQYAFANNSSIESIELPEGLEMIDLAAFWDCERLVHVVLPSTLTYMYGGAFASCYALEDINLPDGLSLIGSGAFNYDNSLTSVEIPASVTEIEGDAFYGCTSITDVYFYGSDFTYYQFEPYGLAEGFAGSSTNMHILSDINPAELTAENGGSIYIWYSSLPGNVKADI